MRPTAQGAWRCCPAARKASQHPLVFFRNTCCPSSLLSPCKPSHEVTAFEKWNLKPQGQQALFRGSLCRFTGSLLLRLHSNAETSLGPVLCSPCGRVSQ